MSLPNLLTVSRIVATPVVVASFYVPGAFARWFACALFTAAAVTDWLDGHMARRWQQQSEIGRFLDPIADKLLVSAIGESLLWVAALLTLVTGYDYLVAGLRHINGPRPAGPIDHCKSERPA